VDGGGWSHSHLAALQQRKIIIPCVPTGCELVKSQSPSERGSYDTNMWPFPEFNPDYPAPKPVAFLSCPCNFIMYEIWGFHVGEDFVGISCPTIFSLEDGGSMFLRNVSIYFCNLDLCALPALFSSLSYGKGQLAGNVERLLWKIRGISGGEKPLKVFRSIIHINDRWVTWLKFSITGWHHQLTAEYRS
jgi:hypothetical protein